MGSANIQGRLWSKGARDWAELQEPMHAPLWRAMLDAAGVAEGTRVCDVGCGGGGAAILAAERGASVSGVDAASTLIDVARERLPGADLRVGDMEALPFSDAVFDAVIAANSIQYAQDRVRAVRELGRVCRPTGTIVIGLFAPPDRVELGAVFGAIRDALPEPPPGKGPFELSQPGVLAGLVAEAGLEIGDAGEVECPFSYPDFATFWRANLSAGPIQAALGSIGEPELMAAVHDAVASRALPDGSLVLRNVFQFVTVVP